MPSSAAYKADTQFSDTGGRSGPMANLPDDARRLMSEIGPKWGTDIHGHRKLVLATYGPLLKNAPKDGVTVTRECAYGPHSRHRADVFRPASSGLAPVVVFVHGGAFVRGSKSDAEGIYDNVLYWFARNGCVGVNVEYRLAPEAGFPAGAEDVGAALKWIHANIDQFGGNPDKVYLVGHSAGATHIATYACDPNVEAKPGPEVRGIVLISGRLRADVHPHNPNAEGVRAYFGDDARLYDARSPTTYAHLLKTPLMIAVAQYDNPLLDVYGAEFFWRVSAARGRAPRFLRLLMHNHSSMAMHFNTGDDVLGMEILDFIREGE